MDRSSLARIEFTLTSTAHYLFVALTLGLVVLVAVQHTRWVSTGDPRHLRQTRFWGMAYVVNYAVGIAAGLVMEFQLALNWSGLTTFAADVFGGPLAIETIVAFFAESTFLALWIFGWRRLPPKLHLATIWLTALMAYLSVFWVMIANGFMNNPVGYSVRDDRLVLDDFGALLLNPNSLAAIAHIAAGAAVTLGFLMLGVGVLLQRARRADEEFLRHTYRIGGKTAFWGALAVFALGIVQFIVVTPGQHQKYWAYYDYLGRFDTYQQQLSDELGHPVKFADPALLSDVARFMTLPGLTMLVIGIWVLIAVRRNRIMTGQRVLRALLVPMMVLPFVAAAGGWSFREYGRQPFAVWKLLTTEDALTPGLTATGAAWTLAGFGLLSLLLVVVNAGIIARILARGPDAPADLWRTDDEITEPDREPATPEEDGNAVLV